MKGDEGIWKADKCWKRWLYAVTPDVVMLDQDSPLPDWIDPDRVYLLRHSQAVLLESIPESHRIEAAESMTYDVHRENSKDTRISPQFHGWLSQHSPIADCIFE